MKLRREVLLSMISSRGLRRKQSKPTVLKNIFVTSFAFVIGGFDTIFAANVQIHSTTEGYSIFSIFQLRRGRMGPCRISGHCVPGAPEISTLNDSVFSSIK